MRRILLIALTSFLTGASVVMCAQLQTPDDVGSAVSPEVRQMRQQMQKDLVKKRLDSVKADATRLAQLSQELKASVDRMNPDATMSVEVIKQADEIAKLAKQVREKMKGQ